MFQWLQVHLIRCKYGPEFLTAQAVWPCASCCHTSPTHTLASAVQAADGTGDERITPQARAVPLKPPCSSHATSVPPPPPREPWHTPTSYKCSTLRHKQRHRTRRQARTRGAPTLVVLHCPAVQLGADAGRQPTCNSMCGRPAELRGCCSHCHVDIGRPAGAPRAAHKCGSKLWHQKDAGMLMCGCIAPPYLDKRRRPQHSHYQLLLQAAAPTVSCRAGLWPIQATQGQ